jgi:hypothetical protein
LIVFEILPTLKSDFQFWRSFFFAVSRIFTKTNDQKMSTGDPLLLLRRTLAAQQPPTLHFSPDSSSPALTKDSLSSATHLFFPSSQLALPLGIPTRFQRKTPEALTFNLREIFFAWLLQTESTAEYISKCQALGIHHLTFLEKADLSTWLEGGDSSDYIGMSLSLY